MKLREYQNTISNQAVEKLHNFGCCYLSMECRTGKTITALVTAARFGAKSVLFVTKLKAIGSIESDYKLLHPSYSIQVVNYESAHKADGNFDLIILDEAHSLGAYPKPSKRTQNVKKLCHGKPVLYLSGTPSPESYSQLYHQFWVCDASPFKEYPTFYKWAKRFVNVTQKRINGCAINDYSAANKRLIDRYAKDLFISYSQEQAGFSTNIIEHIEVVQMQQNSKNMFTQLRKNKVVQSGDFTILADTPAKMLLKLHQISSGTVIDTDCKHHIFDYSKAEYVKSRFKGKKIALFYVYKSEEELLKKAFPNWTETPEEFQRCSDKVFISQVRRAREGVRLDSADALIYFNMEYSYLSYEQGRNRLVSKERTTPADVYFLCSDFGIEKEIMDAVQNKQDFTLSYYNKKDTQKNPSKRTKKKQNKWEIDIKNPPIIKIDWNLPFNLH